MSDTDIFVFYSLCLASDIHFYVCLETDMFLCVFSYKYVSLCALVHIYLYILIKIHAMKMFIFLQQMCETDKIYRNNR